MPLTFRVEGLDRLYLATLGRYPAHGSACYLRPRLFDSEGRCVDLEVGGTLVAANVDAGEASPVEVEVDGQPWRGFALSLGEMNFQLDGKYARFEVDVCYRPQTELPPCAAIDCLPILARAGDYQQTQGVLWDLVANDFRDRQSQIEMELERRDGIWNDYAPTWIGASDAYYLVRTRERLELAHKTLQLVERTSPQAELAAELDVLESRLRAMSTGNAPRPPAGEDQGAARDLFAQAVDLRRRIVFSHPALGFERLLLTKRCPPLLSAPGDNYFGINNETSPGLVVLDDWKADRPRETVLLEGQLPPGCAMQPDVSFDGQRIVFAYADHTPPREQWQFFLYEIRADGTGLKQLTGTDGDRLAGSGGRMTVMPEDYDPCYLPDGGIAFISTRNQGGVRCHNGDRYCPTYLLYRCDADGANVRQLSFGEASEWDPTVMPNGQILWTRWDYINRPVIPTLGLWTIRPDGTAAEHYFGNYTPNPCRICEARPIPGSRRVVATTAGHHTMHAGSLILIDRQIAPDGLEAITRLTPDVTFPESEPYSSVCFASPYPLNEDLYLAAYSADPYPASMAHIPRREAFGIYLVDSLGGRELIYRDPEVSCFEPLPLAARSMPPELPSHVAAAQPQATGVFYVQDVYRSTQDIPRGTIRRLRVNELIPQPTQRVPYSSAVNFDVLKRVLGTVPIEEDGSVAFEAPAGIPLQFQALDERGMAVMTMRTFTHLQPGEQSGCVGCHESRNSGPVVPPSLSDDADDPAVGPARRTAVSRRFEFRQNRPAGARPLLHQLSRPPGDGRRDRSAGYDRRVGRAYRRSALSAAAEYCLRGAPAGGTLREDRPVLYGDLVQPAEGLLCARQSLGPAGAGRARRRDAGSGQSPAGSRLAGSQCAAVWNLLVEQGRVAPGRSEWRAGAVRPHPSAVRRRLGEAAAGGTRQLRVAGREPDPQSAAGSYGRRVGADLRGRRRLDEHQRCCLSQDAAARAGLHPAAPQSGHCRHMWPR